MIWYEAAAAIDADRARQLAKAILRERRFHPAQVPQPFRGPLQRAGDALASAVNRWIGHLPGPPEVAWLLIGGLLVAFVVVVSLRLARRRSSVRSGSSMALIATTEESASELERSAEEAEHAGDLEAVVRLRFRAGLLRLDAAGVIAYRPSMTTSQVARRVGLASFDCVAASFEEIVYGRRLAVADDVRQSRNAWRQVLDEAAA